MALFQKLTKQWINAPTGDVWKFISSPANLKVITPPHLGFEIITGRLPEKMYPGMIIAYKVRPVLGIPVTWVTEITHVEEGIFFVDEQRVGPYALWHHEHRIEAVEEGTLMTDIVSYQLPFGFLGRLVHWLLVRRQLDNIFAFRERAILGIFPASEKSDRGVDNLQRETKNPADQIVNRAPGV